MPGMVQKALSAANAGPCSIEKKISDSTASWGAEPRIEPRRGPSHSAAAVPPTTKSADAAIFAASRTRAEESIRRSGGATAPTPRSSPPPLLRSALVDLLELALRPLHRVFRLHALHALGVHVGDDVLGERLGGLRGRRAGVTEQP